MPVSRFPSQNHHLSGQVSPPNQRHLYHTCITPVPLHLQSASPLFYTQLSGGFFSTFFFSVMTQPVPDPSSVPDPQKPNQLPVPVPTRASPDRVLKVSRQVCLWKMGESFLCSEHSQPQGDFQSYKMMKYYEKFTHQGHLDEDSTEVTSLGQHLSPVEPLLYLSTSAGGAVSPARLLNEAGCSLHVEDKHHASGPPPCLWIYTFVLWPA